MLSRVAPLLVLLLATAVGGCISVYRVDVSQGNIVTQEMVDLLKPGMTPNQVRFVLGTPLITDPFHPQRWDYYYSLRKGGAELPETRRLTVYFQNEQLVRIDGDVTAHAVPPAPVATP
jgi:outer membrane protein assembly factor BamE